GDLPTPDGGGLIVSVWRHITHGLRSLLKRSASDREIAGEVEHYMAEAVSALVSDGVPVAEARRRVKRELGDAAGVREKVRLYGWENFVEALVEDLRFALRRLRRSPGSSTATILTLALGLGATTAIFSAVKPVLLDPLPYPASERIVEITDRRADGSAMAVTFGTYREIAARSRALDGLAVARPWQPTVTEGGEPERLTGQRVSADYFRVLGVPPAFGPSFDPSLDRVGGSKVVVLADALWRSRFGADSTIVGRQIELDGVAYTVVGVMPADFEDVLAPAARVWTLLQYDPSLPSFDGREWGHHLRMVGRLRPGSTAGMAEFEFGHISSKPIPEYRRPSWASLENGLSVIQLKDSITRAAKPGLVAIAAAVLLLLLIACVNVTNLLIARGAQRQGEFAMRAALGAPRTRLVRQVLAESLLLAALAGAVGAGLAVLGVRALVALSPPELPRLAAIGLDRAALLVSLALAAAVGLGVGLAPALRASRVDARSGLHHASRRSTSGHQRTRRALVIAEVSLTLVLLVGAGLLLRSLDRLFAIEPGFDAVGVLTLQVQTSGPRYDDDAATNQFFRLALDAIQGIPGVSHAAMTSQLPLSGEFEAYGVQPASRISDRDADRSAVRYAVSPGYFEAMGIPLLGGRLLEESDRAGGPVAVLISSSLANGLFPGQEAVGQRVHVGRTDLPWYRVVGVVGDIKHLSLAGGESQAVYITPEQWYFADPARWFVVKTRGEPETLVAQVKEAIWSVDRTQPIVRAVTMEDLVAASAAERAFALRLFQTFAIAALLLAAIGLYGVVSGSVAERTREFGVRSALGATRRAVLGLVIRDGLTLTGLGIVVGIAGAVAMTQTLTTLLFGVSPADPITYLGVITILAVVAVLASALPAWRASKIEPSTALRYE
ncbi:MAG: ADOP family duplicated permease, partial [Longimicrobiales bacterium]